MKAFFAVVTYLASVNAIEVGASAYNITSISDVKTVYPVVEAASVPQLSISFMNEVIQTTNETYNMMLTGFSVMTNETSGTTIVPGDYVMSYLSLPDPDATGKYSTLTCTVAYTAGDLYQSADNIWIQNYYGTNSFARGKSIEGGF